MNDNPQDTCACDPCGCVANPNGVKACTTNVFEYADVSVPLKIKPCAVVGKIETECCGEPVITARQCRNASGSCNCSCSCELTMTQTVCIKIPVTYGVDTDIGETIATCKRAPGTGGCCR